MRSVGIQDIGNIRVSCLQGGLGCDGTYVESTSLSLVLPPASVTWPNGFFLTYCSLNWIESAFQVLCYSVHTLKPCSDENPWSLVSIISVFCKGPLPVWDGGVDWMLFGPFKFFFFSLAWLNQNHFYYQITYKDFAVACWCITTNTVLKIYIKIKESTID